MKPTERVGTVCLVTKTRRIRMTKVLDHGIIEIIDHMGTDQTIERTARVSYGGDKKTRTVEETTGLLNYLMKHEHTSPFEHAVVQMYVKCPIFVARQWMRHRTWSYNEVSYRYKEAPCEFFRAEDWRGQSPDNKQMSEGIVKYRDSLSAERQAEGEYLDRLDRGISRELARMCLPLSTYTEFYATVDLHNLLHFLRLRMHEHAQYEIRVYAEVIADWVREHFPITWDAFEKHRL
jgi:thymidylate synthase (FAD)